MWALLPKWRWLTQSSKIRFSPTRAVCNCIVQPVYVQVHHSLHCSKQTEVHWAEDCTAFCCPLQIALHCWLHFLISALLHTALWWDFCNSRHTAVNLESYCTPDEVETEISILSSSSPGDIFPRPCWPLHPSWCLDQQHFSLITTASSIYKSLTMFRANYVVRTAKCAGSLSVAWV